MLIKESILSRKMPQLLVAVGVLSVCAAFFFLHVWRSPIAVTPNSHFLSSPTSVSLKSYFFGQIHYTTDGSSLTSQSPAYVEEIVLDKPSLLRMAVFVGGQQITKEQTHDFFVAGQHTIPVVSLFITDGFSDNFLFNEENHLFGDFKYYETDQQLKFVHKVKIELHGESLLNAPQQSFRLKMVDNGGGEKGVTYPFFGSEGSIYFTSLILRNDDAKSTHLRESVANQLANEVTNLDTQRGKPVALYINGKYWGLYFLRDRFDENYFVQKYGLKAKALGLVEMDLGGDVKGQMIPSNKKSKEDVKKINDLIKKVAHCVRCVGYSVADATIDMHNLTDYLLLQLYFANYDWPYNNYKMWRYRNEDWYVKGAEFIPELDGRFRFLFFDSDVSFGAGRLTAEKMIDAAKGDPYAQLIDNAFPFRNIFYSETFIKRYSEKMNSLLEKEFAAANTDAIVDHYASQVRAEMPAQIQRWKSYNTSDRKYGVETMEEWETQVELLKLYLRERPQFFKAHTEEFFAKMNL